jgi:hypothetical protein
MLMRFVMLFLTSLVIYPIDGHSERPASYRFAFSDSNYFGNAKVSYTINGKKTTIKNFLQTEGENIKALHLNVVGLIPNTSLVRVNFTNSLTHEVFDFVVADKGTTIIKHYKPRLTIQEEKKAAYMSGNLVNYYADYCTVEITIADEKHVVGKFAGQFVADDGSKINIKDGNFDIPMSEK